MTDEKKRKNGFVMGYNEVKKRRVSKTAMAVLDSITLLTECRHLEEQQKTMRCQLESTVQRLDKCLRNLMAMALVMTQEGECADKDKLECINCRERYEADDVMLFCMHVRACCYWSNENEVD